VYGVNFNPGAGGVDDVDYRVLSTEDANITSAVLALNNAATMRGPDNAGVIWRPYANVGYNSYYQRKARS